MGPSAAEVTDIAARAVLTKVADGLRVPPDASIAAMDPALRAAMARAAHRRAASGGLRLAAS